MGGTSYVIQQLMKCDNISDLVRWAAVANTLLVHVCDSQCDMSYRFQILSSVANI